MEKGSEKGNEKEDFTGDEECYPQADTFFYFHRVFAL